MQYEIGNPLTATRMTQHQLPASLYAPLRVVLYENEAGHAVFEYDCPRHCSASSETSESRQWHANWMPVSNASWLKRSTQEKNDERREMDTPPATAG